ncbi:MAG: hypothetical protein ABID54_08280 [Pseudomonadota bacterium]
MQDIEGVERKVHMVVEFKRIISEPVILNPMNEFQEETQPVDVRFDPLTGVRRRFNIALTKKAKMFHQPTDQNSIKMLVEKTAEGCFFCPQNLEKATPKFPPDILPEGRFRRGDSWVFPNLFQAFEVSGVGVIGKDHFLRTDQFSPEIFKNFFTMIIDFFRAVHSRRPEFKYATFGMNYLPPAGSSLLHPHNMVLMDRNPFPHLDSMTKESRAYLDRKSKNFWQDLIETEKQLGERYIGKTGSVEWMAAFSPIAANEFLGIVPGKSNFLEYDDNDLDGIAEGFARILFFYKNDLEVDPFNYIVYSGPLGENSDSFWSHVRISTRPNLTGNYVSDIPLAPLYLGDNFFNNPPEYLASRLKECF